jgi:NADH:ubiquinone oxidoreductase subunit 4 (subunit M)
MQNSGQNLGLLILAALLIPLFPFHGLYSAALTRIPNNLKTLLSIALPIAGLTILQNEIIGAPHELLVIIGILAIFGTLWGSIKALLQTTIPRTLSYAGLALYSLMWWHISQMGTLTTQTWLFVWSVTLTISGIVFGWTRIRARYGNLESHRITGLFQPMPVFSLCFALLIMAAVGLAPFSLFFGYLGLLFSPATGISFGHVMVFVTWFIACWYLFKLMLKLLFGPYRKDIAYKDLNILEASVFIVILVLLILPGSITENWIHKLSPQTTVQLKGAS